MSDQILEEYQCSECLQYYPRDHLRSYGNWMGVSLVCESCLETLEVE